MDPTLSIREYIEWCIESFKKDDVNLTIFEKCIMYPLAFTIFIIGFILCVVHWIGNFIFDLMYK